VLFLIAFPHPKIIPSPGTSAPGIPRLLRTAPVSILQSWLESALPNPVLRKHRPAHEHMAAVTEITMETHGLNAPLGVLPEDFP
jgi:hypothetical protein